MTASDEHLRFQLRALRQDAAPQRDLWPGIAARISDVHSSASHVATTSPARRLAAWGLAASMVLAAGMAWQLQRPAPPAPQPLVQREAEALARQYQGALDELAQLPQAQLADTYSPAMRELDAGAAAILRALEHDPESRLLLDQLRRTYSKRLALGQRAVDLT